MCRANTEMQQSLQDYYIREYRFWYALTHRILLFWENRHFLEILLHMSGHASPLCANSIHKEFYKHIYHRIVVSVLQVEKTDVCFVACSKNTWIQNYFVIC